MQTTTLDDFPLKWRWTDPNYCVLSAEELALIKPLEKDTANEAWQKSLLFISKEHDFKPNKELFKDIEEIQCSNEKEVEKWLKERIQSEYIFVSWQPDVAVIVNSVLFIKYWSEFCYPSSDDVSIWPANEKWVVHYWHEEVFCYGKSKCV